MIRSPRAREGTGDLRLVVAEAVDGERPAAEELYRRFHLTVLAIQLANTGGDRALAWDLTQDTFVKALYRLDRFEWRGPGSFRAWLTAIARNVFRDHVRSASERHHGGYDLPDGVDPDHAGDPEAVAERDLATSRATADRLLGRLRPEHRHVLLRLFGDEAPVAQVAAELGRSPGAVHQLRRRAIDAARRQCEPSGA